jgi:formylglycine-generating enzyme required for sulfatase activity
MRITGYGPLYLFTLLLLAPVCANAQQTPNEIAIAPLVGDWDLPGTLIRLKIHPDGTLDHSSFGAGTIEYQRASSFRVVYQKDYIHCSYDIRKYSENELTFTVDIRPTDQGCELGTLRRSPEDKTSIDARKKAAASNAPDSTEKASASPAGTILKDCEDCPELVIVPSGRFTMGSPDSESGRKDTEGPQRTVEIDAAFAVGRYAITRDQFEAFVVATGRRFDNGCNVAVGNDWELRPELSFRSPGFAQDGRHPVVCVSWDDANDYAKWLSTKTGKSYRLLSEAEREYVTRAGTSSAYWWGSVAHPDQANFDPNQPGPEMNAQNTSLARGATVKTSALPTGSASPPKGTLPVYSYAPNAWGLFQVHGNVAEWVEDCWNRSYMGAPAKALAVQSGNCDRRVVRGGGWEYFAPALRSAHRESARKENRYYHVGFRVARNLS